MKIGPTGNNRLISPGAESACQGIPRPDQGQSHGKHKGKPALTSDVRHHLPPERLQIERDWTERIGLVSPGAESTRQGVACTNQSDAQGENHSEQALAPDESVMALVVLRFTIVRHGAIPSSQWMQCVTRVPYYPSTSIHNTHRSARTFLRVLYRKPLHLAVADSSAPHLPAVMVARMRSGLTAFR
jgi:hypothetical protein